MRRNRGLLAVILAGAGGTGMALLVATSLAPPTAAQEVEPVSVDSPRTRPEVAARLGQEGPVARCDEVVDGQPTVTQFALQPDQSEMDLLIRTARSKSLSLVYDSSCILDQDALDLEVSVEPASGDARDIPQEAQADVNVRVRRDGITVSLPVVRTELSPGSYDGIVVLSGDDIATLRTPVTVSIKDQRWYLAVAATMAGLVAGVAVAAFVALSNRGELVSPIRDTLRMVASGWGIAALLAASGLAFFVADGPFQSGFVGDDRWVWTAREGMGIVAGAFATGTGTAVATLFFGSFRAAARPTGGPQPEEPAARPDPEPAPDPTAEADRDPAAEATSAAGS